MTTKSGDVVLCTCGHAHAVGEKCGAIVSGTPMLTYCPCPTATPHPEAA